MSGCAQKSGFLSLFSCGDPVVGMCVTCGKPVCAAHLQASSNCPDCAVPGVRNSDTTPGSMESSQSGHSGYNDKDYAAFDTVQGGGGEVDGGGASGDWSSSESGTSESGSDSSGAADFQDS